MLELELFFGASFEVSFPLSEVIRILVARLLGYNWLGIPCTSNECDVLVF